MTYMRPQPQQVGHLQLQGQGKSPHFGPESFGAGQKPGYGNMSQNVPIRGPQVRPPNQSNQHNPNPQQGQPQMGMPQQRMGQPSQQFMSQGQGHARPIAFALPQPGIPGAMPPQGVRMMTMNQQHAPVRPGLPNGAQMVVPIVRGYSQNMMVHPNMQMRPVMMHGQQIVMGPGWPRPGMPMNAMRIPTNVPLHHGQPIGPLGNVVMPVYNGQHPMMFQGNPQSFPPQQATIPGQPPFPIQAGQHKYTPHGQAIKPGGQQPTPLPQNQ